MSLSDSFDYDVAVIGGGSAGYAAARTTAAAGQRTVLIEGGKEIGGLCILRGCMPTKALLQSAEVLHQVRRAEVFGIHPGTVRFDFQAVMERKNRLIGEFAEYRRGQLLLGKFQFVHGNARFIDSQTVAISTGEKIRAKHFILCTGSVVAPSPLPDLDQAGFLTSDDALFLTRLPQSLLVLGGGAVAIEFAQFFARFGVRVTLIQRSPHILREMDEDAAAILEEALVHEGIMLYTGTDLVGAGRHHGGKFVEFHHHGKRVRVEAEEIFFGLGRVPNTESLHLEAAHVSVVRGRIVTSNEMQTSAENIYAAGDCTGLHEIVHIAIQQAEVAAHNVIWPERRRSWDSRLLTSVVFSDPQIATVGLTEKAARALGIPYRTAQYPFSDHGKSLLMEAKDGIVKLLADPRTGEILGGGVVGPVGGELIHEIIVAMAKRMTVHELAAVPHYHPTLAEIWTYPAEELAAQIPV